MTASAPTGQPPYTVVDQRHSTEYQPDGTQSGQWTVHLEHNTGTKSTVSLPDSQYSAENVHALAMHQNAAVNAVATLPESVAN